jgi:hypothetical protein
MKRVSYFIAGAVMAAMLATGASSYAKGRDSADAPAVRAGPVASAVAESRCHCAT